MNTLDALKDANWRKEGIDQACEFDGLEIKLWRGLGGYFRYSINGHTSRRANSFEDSALLNLANDIDAINLYRQGEK